MLPIYIVIYHIHTIPYAYSLLLSYTSQAVDVLTMCNIYHNDYNIHTYVIVTSVMLGMFTTVLLGI